MTTFRHNRIILLDYWCFPRRDVYRWGYRHWFEVSCFAADVKHLLYNLTSWIRLKLTLHLHRRLEHGRPVKCQYVFRRWHPHHWLTTFFVWTSILSRLPWSSDEWFLTLVLACCRYFCQISFKLELAVWNQGKKKSVAWLPIYN